MSRWTYYKQKVTQGSIVLTVKHEIITIGGHTILAKNEKAIVVNLYREKGYDSIDMYHDRCTGVEIKGHERIDWNLNVFTDAQCLADENFMYWMKDTYKFHHGGWYRGGQSVSQIRTIQKLYEKYHDEIEHAKWSTFVNGFK